MKLSLLATGVAFALTLGGCPKTQTTTSSPTAAEATPQSQAVFSQDYVLEELDNGLRVMVVKTDYPDVVSLQIPVSVGSRNEVEPGKTGFAPFL